MAGIRCQHFCRTRSWLSRSSSTTSSSIGCPIAPRTWLDRFALLSLVGVDGDVVDVHAIRPRRWNSCPRVAGAHGIQSQRNAHLVVSHGKVVGLGRRRRAGSVGQLLQPLVPQLGGPPHSGRPEGAGSMAAIDGHDRETLARTVRPGRHRSPSRIIAGAGRQLRRRSA